MKYNDDEETNGDNVLPLNFWTRGQSLMAAHDTSQNRSEIFIAKCTKNIQ